MQDVPLLHTISPTNLLHLSTAPHFKTFNAILIYSKTYPIFRTTQKLCSKYGTSLIQ